MAGELGREELEAELETLKTELRERRLAAERSSLAESARLQLKLQTLKTRRASLSPASRLPTFSPRLPLPPTPKRRSHSITSLLDDHRPPTSLIPDPDALAPVPVPFSSALAHTLGSAGRKKPKPKGKAKPVFPAKVQSVKEAVREKKEESSKSEEHPKGEEEDFDVELECRVLMKAKRGRLGVEVALEQTLGRRSYAQRQQIRRRFEELTGQSLLSWAQPLVPPALEGLLRELVCRRERKLAQMLAFLLEEGQAERRVEDLVGLLCLHSDVALKDLKQEFFLINSAQLEVEIQRSVEEPLSAFLLDLVGESAGTSVAGASQLLLSSYRRLEELLHSPSPSPTHAALIRAIQTFHACAAQPQVYLSPILAASIAPNNPRLLEIVVGRCPLDIKRLLSYDTQERLRKEVGGPLAYVLNSMIDFWSSPEAQKAHKAERLQYSVACRALLADMKKDKGLNFAAKAFLRAKPFVLKAEVTPPASPVEREPRAPLPKPALFAHSALAAAVDSASPGALVAQLVSLPPAQRRKAVARLEADRPTSLFDAVRANFQGKEKEKTLGLYTMLTLAPARLKAYLVDQELEGFPHHPRVVVAVLAEGSGRELAALLAAYQQMFDCELGSELLRNVADPLLGQLLSRLVAVSGTSERRGPRDSAKEAQTEWSEASRLYMDSSRPYHLNFPLLVTLLTLRDGERSRGTLSAYERISGHSVATSAGESLSGPLKAVVVALLGWLGDSVGFVAAELSAALAQPGVHEQRLAFFLIAAADDATLPQLQTRFARDTHTSLVDAVKKNCSPYFAEALLPILYQFPAD